MDLNQRIEKLIEAGEASYRKPSAENLKIEQRPGKRYIKLVCSHYNKRTGERAHSSVWCFIDKESGAVYKPASFKAPAKHIRYLLMDDDSFQEAINRADWSGVWLYIR
tara:strand:+ start:49 stop:372 length:324 start_codon:yes stop_codon:yes gene_type:complete